MTGGSNDVTGQVYAARDRVQDEEKDDERYILFCRLRGQLHPSVAETCEQIDECRYAQSKRDDGFVAVVMEPAPAD